MKKILSVFLTMLLFVNVFSIVSLATDEEREILDSGTCGENATWVLYKDGELIISGEGPMNHYNSSTTPWKAYYKSITKATVNPGITTIGDYVFDGLFFVTEFSLPETVTAIGKYAFAFSSFAYQNGWHEIIIPDSVETIAANAFYSSYINRIILPSHLTVIKRGVFKNCSKLTMVVLPDTVTTIEDNAFDSCDKISEVYYKGTQEQWNAIDFGAGNGYLKNNSNITYSYICHEYEVTRIAPTCQMEGYDQYVCRICGDTYRENYTDKVDHSTHNGQCDMCGKYIVEEQITVALSVSYHAIGDIEWALEKENAEITETGQSTIIMGDIVRTNSSVKIKGLSVGTNTVKAAVSGEIIASAEIEILPHTHSYAVSETIAPTCTEKGCDVFLCACGDTYAVYTDEPFGHTEEIIPANAATCTQSGLTIGKQCSVCGEILIAQQEIQPAGHQSGEWEIVTPAEVGSSGFEVRKCKVCGEITDEREIPAIEEPEYMTGDINGDGRITASDARIVLRISAKLETITLYNVPEAVADANGDGAITASDARKILRVSAKLEEM